MPHLTPTAKSSKGHAYDTRTPCAAGPRGITRVPPLYGIEFVDGAVQGEGSLQLMPRPDRRRGAQDIAPVLSRDQSPSAPNHTGLPDNLKSGIESLSGIDLSDVNVHFNSSKPALLDARAYTQGTEIHVAPGQEQHLPHEAWHVVQQKQGRVQPRFQLKGEQINDDCGLEQDADMVSEKASWVQDAAIDSRPVVQRSVLRHQDKTGTKDIETLANSLDKCVDFAKLVVDQNPLLTDVTGRENGYLGAWVEVFNKFTENGNIPSFFYARYGYAIETLATSQFMVKDKLGYEVDAQATYGGTRPDFVIRKGKDDVAWIDITSEDSKGHIFLKQGSGWRTRPYVAEVLYKMPDAKDFANTAKGTLSPEQITALTAANEQKVKEERAFQRGMQAMGQILGAAYAVAYEKKNVGKEKKEGLSRKEGLDVLVTVCREHLTKYDESPIGPKIAAGVLTVIDSLEVAGIEDTGTSWTAWAYGSTGADRSSGRRLLRKFGEEKR